MQKDVIWVNHTLGRKAVENFIKTYLEKYPEISKSKTPNLPRRSEPGQYFINFIETCRKNLLSNPRYYHYNNAKKECHKMNGPNLVYSLLLKHIVHNAKKYSKPESDKILKLLSWFEQQGITQLVVIPLTRLDKYCKQIFEEYSVFPGYYTGQEDGTLGYCSLNGTPVETGGMEISNTRVHQLLKTIHGSDGDDEGDGDGDGDGAGAGAGEGSLAGAGGKKRQIHKSRTRTRTRRRRHPSTQRTQRRRRRATRTRRN